MVRHFVAAAALLVVLGCGSEEEGGLAVPVPVGRCTDEPVQDTTCLFVDAHISSQTVNYRTASGDTYAQHVSGGPEEFTRISRFLEQQREATCRFQLHGPCPSTQTLILPDIPDDLLALPETPPGLAHAETPAASAHEVNLLQVVEYRVTTTHVGGAANPSSEPGEDLHMRWDPAAPPNQTAPERITIHLPESVVVTALELTAGYTEIRGRLDWFAAHSRIEAVRIQHGDDTFEARLDIEDRSMQRVPVSGSGGDWTIEVTAWAAGSRPSEDRVVTGIRVLGEVEAEEGEPELAPGPCFKRRMASIFRKRVGHTKNST